VSIDVLAEAHDLIHGERLRFYGPPATNFERIAGMWSAYLGIDVTANDVCCMMILLKAARIRSGGAYHRDSAVDVAGYAALLEALNES
jgi:hypothetical protein